MRVGVEPKRRGLVQEVVFIDKFAARQHQVRTMWVTAHIRWDARPVGVDGGRLGQAVGEIDFEMLTLPHTDDGSQVAIRQADHASRVALDQFGLVGQNRGFRAGQQRGLAHRGAQIQLEQSAGSPRRGGRICQCSFARQGERTL